MSDDSKSVLIVDDDKPLANVKNLKLESEGVKTDWASDGQECMDLLDKKTYGIILLDLMMPGFDGFQVLEHLKTQGGTMPTVFVVSNLSQQDDIKRAMELGAVKYFIK